MKNINLEIFEDSITKVVFKKLKKPSAEIQNVIFFEPKEKKLYFHSSITAVEKGFKCSYFVQSENTTYAGEYLIDEIHTDILLPTIIHFAMSVTNEVEDENVIYEIAYEIAGITRKAAVDWEIENIIEINPVEEGESIKIVSSSNLMFLDKGYYIGEKIKELKGSLSKTISNTATRS